MDPLGSMTDTLLGTATSDLARPSDVGSVLARALELGGAISVDLEPRDDGNFILRSRIDDEIGEIDLIVWTHVERFVEAPLPELLDGYHVQVNRDLAMDAHSFVEQLRANSLHDVIVQLAPDAAAPTEPRAEFDDYVRAVAPSADLEAQPKHISARVVADEPVVVQVPFRLDVKVGDPVPDSLFEGQDDVISPTDIPADGLDTEWIISSSDFEFGVTERVTPLPGGQSQPGGAVQFPLHIPREGDSEAVTLELTPLREGTCEIQFRMLAKGELYRSLSAEVDVTRDRSAPAKPIGTKHGITRRGDRLGVAPTAAPEELHIYVLESGVRALVTGSGPGWSFRDTLDWPAKLTQLDTHLKNVRKAADELRVAHDEYLNAIPEDDLARALEAFAPIGDWSALPSTASAESRDGWEAVRASPELHELAVRGRSLYEAIFPPGTQLRSLVDKLRPGALLNVTWSDSSNEVPDVPWTLMYALAQDEEIEPLGFLGLRFRLKYFGYATRGLTETFIGAPDQIDTACCLFWGQKEEDLVAEVKKQRGWRAAVRRIFLPSDTGSEDAKQSILGLLKAGNDEPVGVVYLFCHYGKLGSDEVAFRFGDNNDLENVISLYDLESIALRPVPLVFANACGTSGEDAFHAHRVKHRFFNQGAGAYIGTEAEVPVAMASRFGTALLALFEGRPDGDELTLGEAVAQARMLLWTRYCNIGGLFYALVNEDTLQRRAKPEAIEAPV